MKFATFAKAKLQPSHTVMGLTLRPLSIGHYLWMDYCGSRYSSEDDASISVEDLLTACVICFHSYEDFGNRYIWTMPQTLSRENVGSIRVARVPDRTLHKWYSPRAWQLLYVSKYGRLAYDVIRWRNELLKDKELNVAYELAKFQRYLTDSTTLTNPDTNKPLQVRATQTGRKSKTHWSITYLNTLMGKLHKSESDALNMPIAEALALHISYLEAEGALEFPSLLEEHLMNGDVMLATQLV